MGNISARGVATPGDHLSVSVKVCMVHAWCHDYLVLPNL
jgi:hypothetical protein